MHFALFSFFPFGIAAFARPHSSNAPQEESAGPAQCPPPLRACPCSAAAEKSAAAERSAARADRAKDRAGAGKERVEAVAAGGRLPPPEP